MVGKNIECLRKERGIKQKDFIAKIQVMDCDMNPTSYSKLEGQLRSATDIEIYTISKYWEFLWKDYLPLIKMNSNNILYAYLFKKVNKRY